MEPTAARARAVAAVTLTVALVLSGCGGGEEHAGEPAPTWEEATAALADCPAGDGAWRAALGLARSPELLDELYALAERLAGECTGRWEPSWTAGECRFRQRRPGDAGAPYGEALRRASESEDPTGIACSANRLGWLAYQRGELPESDALYRRALDASLRAERPDLEAFVRNNLAGLLIETGDFAAARAELGLAAAGLRRLGLDGPARGAAFNGAIMLRQLGNALEARRALDALHDEAREAGDADTVDRSLLSLGNLHLDLREPDRAAAFYGEVSDGNPRLAVRARLGLGRAALALGDHEQAARILGEAVQAAGEADPLVGSWAAVFLAEAELRSGRHEPARERLERLIAESDDADNAETGWFARWTLGRLLLVQEQPAEAEAVLSGAVEILDRQGAPLNPLREGLHFLRRKADPYADLAAAITAQRERHDVAARVLALAGRAQARALRFDLAAGEDPIEPPDLDAIRGGLERDELLLNYLLGEDRGVLLAVRAGGARAVPVAGMGELREPLRRYRDALRRPLDPQASADADPAADAAAGATLYRELLSPVEDWLAGAGRVYVVPDRELALLPFAALPIGGPEAGTARRYLGDDFEVAVMPLAGPPVRVAGDRAPVLLMGQPSLAPDSGYPELPWAGYELSQLRELWGADRTTLINEGALSLEGVRAAATETFRTLHFATHAEASTRDPQRCGVVLSGGERLGIDQIVGLGLDDALVVLSACRTGEGEVVPGEGVIGLGWAFLRAGASGIVVSQWTVDDAASARLMVAFHRHLRDGADPVRALARAGREIRRDRPEPAYWAPFVVLLRPA